MKIKSNCNLSVTTTTTIHNNSQQTNSQEETITNATTTEEQVHNLPGICFLRGNAVAILVALFCNDDDDENNKIYSLLVDQPR